MKLNSDCIRDVLLCAEKMLTLSSGKAEIVIMQSLSLRDIAQELPQYSKEDIFYTLFNLEQANYLRSTIIWGDDGVALKCRINYITFSGHEFLDRIRDSKRWSTVKAILNSVRDYSLDAINAVAGGIASAAISKCIDAQLL